MAVVTVPAPSEGSVRFTAKWTPGPPPDHPRLAELDALRTRLWDRGWLGALPNGVGYGNVSLRVSGAPTFVITATGSGASRRLDPGGYVLVLAADPARNTVVCTGPRVASAEAMSHAAVYAAEPRAGCVIHIHAREFWAAAIRAGTPTTPPEAEYGTPAMAEEVARLVSTLAAPAAAIAMAGHEDGLLACGPDPGAAEEVLLDLWRRLGFAGGDREQATAP